MLLGLINAGIGFKFAGNARLNTPYGAIVAAIIIVLILLLSFQFFCRSRRKYKPESTSPLESDFGTDGMPYSDYEMLRQPTFGEEPPLPYEPTTPYSPVAERFVLYSPNRLDTPYTPLSAYTPVTPKTWRKEEVTKWPKAPYKEFG